MASRPALLATALALLVPAVAGASPGDGVGEVGMSAGGPRLLVTFEDAPPRATAERRLRGLGRVVPALPEAGIWSLRPALPAAARARVLARARVAGAEWSLLRRASELTRISALPLPSAVPEPTDPFYAGGVQWALRSGRWSPAITARPRPRIAILDGGLEAGHEEWRGARAVVAGRSTHPASPRWRDWSRTGHATHVTGIAAAPANGVGIVGVAPAGPAGRVIPVKVADPEGRSTDETLIRGIRWAVRSRARVINISAGGPGFSEPLHDAVRWALDRGVLIVASVGNDGDAGGLLNYPAAYPGVLGVAAQCGAEVRLPACPEPFGVATFSNRNRSVDLVAPGVDVVSAVPLRVTGDRVAPGYARKSGTSMAAPFVAGAAVLVLANHPRLSPSQVRRQLLSTAVDIGPRGRDLRSGNGVVNPQAAAALSAPPEDPHEVDDVPALAHRLSGPYVAGRPAQALIDAHDDPHDVYAVALRRGDTLRARVGYDRGRVSLSLWRPGTLRVGSGEAPEDRLAHSSPAGRRRQAVTLRAPRSGRFFLDVAAQRGATPYNLVAIRDPSTRETP
jgi:hypothetical protein